MTRPCALCAVGANFAAGVVAVVTHDLTLTAVVGGITAAALAIVTAVKILTPAIVEAIKTIGPALAELQKQRDDIRKGSLSGQLEELRADLTRGQADLKRVTEEGNERVEDANRKLHEAKNQAQADTLEREVQVRELREELRASRQETHEAREELHALRSDLAHAHETNVSLMADIKRLQTIQGQQIANNRHDIAESNQKISAVAEIVAGQSSDEIPTDLAPPTPPPSGRAPAG